MESSTVIGKQTCVWGQWGGLPFGSDIVLSGDWSPEGLDLMSSNFYSNDPPPHSYSSLLIAFSGVEDINNLFLVHSEPLGGPASAAHTRQSSQLLLWAKRGQYLVKHTHAHMTKEGGRLVRVEVVKLGQTTTWCIISEIFISVVTLKCELSSVLLYNPYANFQGCGVTPAVCHENISKLQTQTIKGVSGTYL